ncbi:hypothetical protein OFQ59_10145 [Brachyspira hyodysenteriae]|nr:hypothetical protein [Brachyspira hyodysenteriae]MCZ9970440.1 hypothetical protein [Brachyspira hyodysenteriae]
MGNVMEKSILDIWKSCKDIREELLNYNIAELPINNCIFNKGVICLNVI